MTENVSEVDEQPTLPIQPVSQEEAIQREVEAIRSRWPSWDDLPPAGVGVLFSKWGSASVDINALLATYDRLRQRIKELEHENGLLRSEAAHAQEQ